MRIANVFHKVSLIITVNHREHLHHCLYELNYQTVSSFEVIVIGDVAENITAIKTAKTEQQAYEIAAGDLLVFMPDDVVLHDDFIENLLVTYNKGKTFDQASADFTVSTARLDKPEIINEALSKITVESSKLKLTQPFLSYPIKLNYLRCGHTIKRLHIVIVSNEFTYFTHHGGVGTLFYQLATSLLQMGHKVSVVSPGLEDKIDRVGRFTFYHVRQEHIFYSNLKIPVYCKNMNWSLSAAHKVMEIHRHDKIDVVESALWDVEAYALTQSQCDIPVIVRLVTPLKIAQRINQFNISQLDLHLGIAAEKTLMSRAQMLGVISENIGITIQMEYDIKADDRWQRMLVGMTYRPEACVKPTVDQLFVIDQRLTEIPQHAFKVLFIGRLEMRKGIDILLNAAWDVLKINKDFYFIIAGRNSQQWQSYVREKLGETYQDHFIFLDEIPLDRKDHLYAFSDVVTFPSRFESFGMVGLETTVHGKPIIAAEAGGIPEVVEHEVNGLLFPIGDTEALSSALLRLKNDTALYVKLTEGAKAKRRELSARNMAIDSLQHYKKLIPSRDETLHRELEVNA